MDLIKMLTEAAGIDESTAKQGAGLVFGKAKEHLGAGDFGQLTDLIPEAGQLADEAPAEDSGGGGGLLGAIGGMAQKAGLGGVGEMAGMAGMLSKLGISMDQVGPFLQTIVSFVESKGGPQAKALLEKFLQTSK